MRGDELHQLWVQGRGGQWSDVLLDSSGVVFGIGLFMLMQSMRKFFRKAATLMVCCLLCGGVPIRRGSLFFWKSWIPRLLKFLICRNP